MAERFTVGSVTGWLITPSAMKSPDRPPESIWYVYDSAYGYAVTGEFHRYATRDRYDRWVTVRRREDSPEDVARRYARLLNERENS